jgi:hypothetical protein
MWESVIHNTCPCGREENRIEFFDVYDDAKEAAESDFGYYCSECREALDNGWTTVAKMEAQQKAGEAWALENPEYVAKVKKENEEYQAWRVMRE